MTTDRELARDGVAFARACSSGDIDGALAIYRDHDPRVFAVMLGGMLGSLIGGLGELPGLGHDSWGAMVEGAERLET